jgi:DNA sulfur modification protein DndD
LDQLVLHNVGTFAGRHTIELTPPKSSKPIVLIGGLNGAGKTTVLEAIHLALYGPLAQVSGRRNGGYENYLRSLIHREASESEGAALELTFHAHQEGVEREYWVRRSWRSTGSSIREILLVSVDGSHDAALTSTWNEHIEAFLPKGIAGLFFFDGEQIEALADLDRSQEVLSSALASLLGLDLVDRLSTDLAVLRRRHQDAQVPARLREAIDERQNSVTAARQSEESTSQELAGLRVEAERAEKHLFELNEAYRSAGGELVDQRESAEEVATKLRAGLSAAEEELRQEMTEIAPLLQVRSMLSQLVQQAEREATAAQDRLITDVLAHRDEEITKRLAEAKMPSAAREELHQFLARDREIRLENAHCPEVIGAATVDPAAVRHLATSALDGTRRRMIDLINKHSTTRTELEHAERVLIAIPDPEALAALVSERQEALTQLVRKQAALTHAEERLTLLRQDRAKQDAAYEAALDEAAKANVAADDARRLVEHVDRVRSTLQELRLAASRRHLGRISEFILDALGRLLRKEDLITKVDVDPESHVVELTGRDGLPLSADELSAGERQLLAVALLWGLAKAAGQPLPVMIDTPLGRLDGSHREHLLERYFPHASHQVILLSTDTEIDKDAFERIRGNVGRSYRLIFDQSKNATSVHSGYFWE